jgi:hypothetical protein
MNNPWTNISWNNTVADCDKHIISPAYCAEKGIDISNLPEPYTGNINSNVVCLNLNPGIGKCDACFRFDSHFLSLTQETLCHRIDHLMWLDNDLKCEFGGLHGGCKWWQSRTKELRKELGEIPLNMFIIEFFPYHTQNAFDFPPLPSDDYRNELLSKALHDKKLIIIMRGKNHWKSISGLGSELKKYDNKIELDNPRNVSFSPRNVGNKWNKLVSELKNTI